MHFTRVIRLIAVFVALIGFSLSLGSLPAAAGAVATETATTAPTETATTAVTEPATTAATETATTAATEPATTAATEPAVTEPATEPATSASTETATTAPTSVTQLPTTGTTPSSGSHIAWFIIAALAAIVMLAGAGVITVRARARH